MIKLLYILVYLALFVGSDGEDIDLDLSVNRNDWLDPNDPLSSPLFCSKSTLDQLANCKMDLEECLKDNKKEISTGNHVGKYYTQDPTLKHIIRNLLHHMHVDIDKTKHVDRTVEVYLSADNLGVLRKYLNSKEETIVQREQVREILEKMIVPHDYEDHSFLMRVSDTMIAYLPILNVLLLLPALMTLIYHRYSVRSFMWLIFFTSFIISVFNTYNRKYQEIVASRMSRAEKSVAERCKSESHLSTFLSMMSGLFFVKQKSECVQYYEDLYIDPVYQIAPLDVICEVLSNFIFTPLGIFGRHLNTFFNEFYRDSPLHIIVVKTIAFIFLVAAMLFWLCGYRLRTLVATIEPAGTTYAMPPAVQRSINEAIEQRSKIKALKPDLVLSSHQTDLRSRSCAISDSNLRRRSLSASRLKAF